MQLTLTQKRAIWLSWLFIVPFGIWFTHQFYPPRISGLQWELAGFLLLTAAVAAMPMIINNTPIFLIQWVSLAVFLTFGLFAEMAMMQAAVVVLLMRIRIRKDELFRLPLNSLMFFLVSFLAGLIYYEIGGLQGADLVNEPKSLLLTVIYAGSYFTLNQVVLTFILYLLYGRDHSFFGKDFIWEAVTSLITFPIGLLLYVLYQQMGMLALLFVGVPFASLSIILNLYYSSEKINDYLQKATEIGHQLAEQLHVEEVLDLFIKRLTGMLPVDYAYILEVVDEDELRLIRRFENGNMESKNIRPLKKNEGISGHVWSTRKTALFNSRKEWKKYSQGYLPQQAESVLSVPIVRNNKVTGILVLASQRKRAFEKAQLMITDILCSHLGIAVENAKHFEETKEQSERCALTKLYNYRYFDQLLRDEFEKLHEFKRNILSLIILDIDHFKMVNDTYGHQSGNEILIELAARLTSLVGQQGTVARYGGEEFVILLPDKEKEEVLELAELVRQMIANRPFIVKQNIDSDRKKMMVRITASIGVATAPQEAEDPLSLIRHADRALYVGAKRAGRNRVAEYVK
ncbi:GGDEF domain-containing protein [Bacillus canaveralius]|uniref:GGDEF domain-containing protein n=1 Tax=Bacillus canaveralius TaxID=1403243 RepID=A0A2N5GQ48_9BACI|nr:sensor domain-containing diguanylate cyclase [Bacillus canaveralius]PLR84992.1 GGDEF domain-containing protein [Bacillus canaveralius]PLR93253.1 GGDEF domain-containing protein [Bacillus canaveralius]RSK52453.1 GGDEF domain-containing protein [Bacillus canaveralius]